MIGRFITTFVITLGIGVAASPLAAQEQQARDGSARPNVVVLLADDLGYKDIGCYGGPVKTPALDGLAAGGVRFTDFYSGAAVCSPSRATLLTGRQHLRAGVYSWIDDHAQNSHLLRREVTIAEMLKSHGYQTVHLGKWHLGMPTPKRRKPTPAEHGFDYWFATANNAQPSHKDPVNFVQNGTPVGKIAGYACQLVVDEAISWLDEKRDAARPFFLNVWFHEPHAPLAAPDEIVSRYGAQQDPAAIYSGTIDNTDRAIARLLEKLAQVAPRENTLIVYSSDNGSYRSDRVGRLRATKGSNYDGGLRVPGIFYWPGTIQSGHTEHEPAGLVDLLPTVCGLLGIDKPRGIHLDGSDLSPLLTGRTGQWARHQPLYWLLPASGPAVAIRDGKYSLVAHRTYKFPKDRDRMTALMEQIEEILRKKGTLEAEIRGSTLQKQMFEGFNDREAEKLRGQYIRLNMFNESWIPAIRSGTYGRFELFDMAEDPGQRTDVSRRHPEVAARLKKRLLEITASVMADAPDWSVEPLLALELPREFPLWEKGPPEPAIPREDVKVKERVRSHRIRPESPSGLNRVFSSVSSPTYSIHRPLQPNGVGLVICPGGGFRDVWLDREGHDLAIWLKQRNVTSLVLKYRTRLPNTDHPANAWPSYLRAVRADGWQAVRVLRRQAAALGLQPTKIGISGFSAGGHLAISCALHPEPKLAESQVSGMPSFAGLFYPGIPHDAAEVIKSRTASGATPSIGPFFIVNARDDQVTPADKCLDFYAALLRAGVNAELHVFSKGAHGFDLGAGRGKSTAMWPTSFAAWLRDNGMIGD